MKRGDNAEIDSILIVKLSSLGDIILIGPALDLLRATYPTATIELLTQENGASLGSLHPALNNVSSIPMLSFKHPLAALKLLCQIIKKLRKNKYDLVLDFQGLFKSWIFTRLVKAKVRGGKGCFPLLDFCSPHKRSYKRHALVSYFELTAKMGLPTPPIAKMKLGLKLPKGIADYTNGRFSKDSKFIVLNPFTRWESKKWLPEYWIKLGTELVAKGYCVIIGGAASDEVESRVIAEEIGARRTELGDRSWEIGAGRSELGNRSWEIGARRTELGERNWENRTGRSELGERNWENRTGRSELGEQNWGNRTPNSELNGKVLSCAGKVSLLEYCAILQKAEALVTVDSAPMHLAIGLGTRVIGIFGPTDPERTGPFGKKTVALGKGCARYGHCLRRKCSNKVCMLNISPEIVLDKVLKKIVFR